MLNINTLKKLAEIHQEDNESLDILYSSLKSFEEYHLVIYEMELWMKIYSYKSIDKEEYQSKVTDMDRRRTMCHNSVLSSVNILNRLAAKENLPLVYDGVVSEERPYRREVANAVCELLKQIQTRFAKFNQKEVLDEILSKGAKRAKRTAKQTLFKTTRVLGLN